MSDTVFNRPDCFQLLTGTNLVIHICESVLSTETSEPESGPKKRLERNLGGKCDELVLVIHEHDLSSCLRGLAHETECGRE